MRTRNCNVANGGAVVSSGAYQPRGSGTSGRRSLLPHRLIRGLYALGVRYHGTIRDRCGTIVASPHPRSLRYGHATHEVSVRIHLGVAGVKLVVPSRVTLLLPFLGDKVRVESSKVAPVDGLATHRCPATWPIRLALLNTPSNHHGTGFIMMMRN